MSRREHGREPHERGRSLTRKFNLLRVYTPQNGDNDEPSSSSYSNTTMNNKGSGNASKSEGKPDGKSDNKQKNRKKNAKKRSQAKRQREEQKMDDTTALMLPSLFGLAALVAKLGKSRPTAEFIGLFLGYTWLVMAVMSLAVLVWRKRYDGAVLSFLQAAAAAVNVAWYY
ncbi:hypothetical protein TWF696_006691 [Orbilia brochopaga]|uniref:Uncharacterized protein n=1 Tax=Orbilia brochopaga TaxID=3140254 RepID=A0AAV9UQR9_9PEZI